MSKQQVIITAHVAGELDKILSQTAYSSVFILMDENSRKYCFSALSSTKSLSSAKIMETPAGDDHKNIDALANIWKYLSENGATRKSLIINVGGGMITDLGGFAASTFKRGIDYINVPTTLLGAIDAAVGGKTGINFMGLKNEIGSINPAKFVIIDPHFFKTLDKANFLSGYAEMLKHALISSGEELREIFDFDLNHIDYQKLGDLLTRSVAIKEAIVEKDPREQNIRKALNFGHTVGHAFESFSYQTRKPLLHGYAVAYGIICELYLSHKKLQFPSEILQQICRLIVSQYSGFTFNCGVYPALYELMTHDKKNETKDINFTLLGTVGDIRINQIVDEKAIFEALDFYRDWTETI